MRRLGYLLEQSGHGKQARPLHSFAESQAHVHEHHESAFFVLSGSDIELWSGERLEEGQLSAGKIRKRLRAPTRSAWK